MPDDFVEWFKKLELKISNTVDVTDKFESRISDNNTLSLKYYPDYTQVFDKNNTFLFDTKISFSNNDLDCLLEITSLYGPFKERYGLVCKLYQVRVLPCGDLFSFVEN